MIKVFHGFLSAALILTSFSIRAYSQTEETVNETSIVTEEVVASEKPKTTQDQKQNLAKTKIQINIGDNNKVIEISGIEDSEITVDKNNTQSKETITTTTQTENATENTTSVIETNTNSKNETNSDSKNETTEESSTVSNIETNSGINAGPNSEVKSEVNNITAPIEIKTQTEPIQEVEEETPIIVIVPKPEAPESTDPEDTELVVDDQTHPTNAQAKTTEEPLSRFSLRGTFGYGQISNFDDITSKYSLGFAVAYDLSDLYSLEFQYIFSQYEDNEYYNFFAQANISGYVFDQQELALILNYKVLPLNGFDISLRGGYNHISRSAYNNFTGETNTAQGSALVLGAKADVRITRNVSVVGILDYNLSLKSSGYNEVSSPLFMVGGENFLQLNFGLKYQF